MNTLIEMTALFLRRPASDAPAAEIAAWYRAKARIHECLAREDGAEAEQEWEYAAAAREHASALDPTNSSYVPRGGSQLLRQCASSGRVRRKARVCV